MDSRVVFSRWLAGRTLGLLARYGKYCFPKNTLHLGKHVQIIHKAKQLSQIKSEVKVRYTEIRIHERRELFLDLTHRTILLSKAKKLTVGLANLEKRTRATIGSTTS